MTLYTHGAQPLHRRCPSCDASTAEIQRLRGIVAAQDRRILDLQKREIDRREANMAQQAELLITLQTLNDRIRSLAQERQ